MYFIVRCDAVPTTAIATDYAGKSCALGATSGGSMGANCFIEMHL